MVGEDEITWIMDSVHLAAAAAVATARVEMGQTITGR